MIRLSIKYFVLSFCFFLFGGLNSAFGQQCGNSGIVLSVVPDCGVQFVDLETATVYFATEGGKDLKVNQTFGFEVEPSTLNPGGCHMGASVLATLTCVGDAPCKANFASYVDELNPHLLHFSAQIHDETNQTCEWNFSFGHTAYGKDVNVEFPEKGDYTVELTVTGVGCSDTETDQVTILDVNTNNCGFDIQATAVGLTLMGQVDELTSDGQSQLLDTRWYNGRTGQTFSTDESLNFPLPDYGIYNVCLAYEAQFINGTNCKATKCENLAVLEPSCYNESLENYDVICPSLFAPVCGCDGVTYSNECEAMAAGLTKWWVGDCAGQSGTCASDFSAKILSGSISDGYLVEFTNLSTGGYQNTSFDFGDGSDFVEGDWSSMTHHYAEGSMILARLSVWKNEDEVSVANEIFSTDAASLEDEMPAGTGYVLPGDTDGNGKVNAHDILNIGVAYYEEGVPRQDASIDLVPQLAANWGDHTGTNIDHKHLDCDGNGLINEFDVDAFEEHYQALDALPTPNVEGAPEVYLQFDQDTIVLTQGSSGSLHILADLMVGRPTNPIFNMYGLSLAMHYPEYVNHNTIGYYTGEDFFGPPTKMLWVQRNIPSKQQHDIAITRKTAEDPVSGYGRLAQIDFTSDFIIIVDVVLREDAKVIPFIVDLESVKVIDEHGNPMELNVTQTDTLWIKVDETSGLFDAKIQNTLDISPNPATTQTTIELPQGVQSARLEIYDVAGKMVQSQTLSDARNDISVVDLKTGVYQLKLITDDALYSGRLIRYLP